MGELMDRVELTAAGVGVATMLIAALLIDYRAALLLGGFLLTLSALDRGR